MDRRPSRFPLARLALAAGLALACGPADPSADADAASTGPASLPEPAGELTCRPLPAGTGGREPTDLFPAGDSAFGVLYARERVVELRSPGPGTSRTVPFDREGPRGVVDAAGAALLGDSLLVLADRPRGRLKLLTRDGRDAGFVELGFPPQAIAEAGGRLYASPFVLAPDRRALLYRVDPTPPERPVRPVGIEPLPFDDPGWTALGNMVALAGAPDGSLLLAHRLARARAYLLAPGEPRPRPVRVAMDDREASRLGVRPATPFGEEALDRIAVPVLDAAAGPGPGGMAYLTRSGDRPADGPPPRLLVRIDTSGGVASVHRVPVEGRLLVRHPRGGAWVIADAGTLWRCAEPDAAG